MSSGRLCSGAGAASCPRRSCPQAVCEGVCVRACVSVCAARARRGCPWNSTAAPRAPCRDSSGASESAPRCGGPPRQGLGCPGAGTEFVGIPRPVARPPVGFPGKAPGQGGGEAREQRAVPEPGSQSGPTELGETPERPPLAAQPPRLSPLPFFLFSSITKARRRMKPNAAKSGFAPPPGAHLSAARGRPWSPRD